MKGHNAGHYPTLRSKPFYYERKRIEMMNPTRHRAAHFQMPETITPENARPVERRQAWLARQLWAWFFDTDLDTVEKLLITGKVILSLAVLVLNSRLIATPPPVIQGWALVLPAPVWCLTLIALAIWHIRARIRVDFCARRNAMLCAGLVCGSLCGSLWLRAPTILILVLPGVVGQIVVAARLSRECKQQQRSGRQ